MVAKLFVWLVSLLVVLFTIVVLGASWWGCGGSRDSVAADPSLALPDYWKVQPQTFMFLDLETEGGPSRDMIYETELSIRYLRQLYLPSLGMIEDRVTPEVAMRVVLYHRNDDINYGRAWHYPAIRECEIWLNEAKIAEVPILWDRVLRNTLVHEVGHCLGLVVTATESAQRSAGDTLNHCRHFECAMTLRGLGSDYDQFIAWLTSTASNEPAYCEACEQYIKGRIVSTHGGE